MFVKAKLLKGGVTVSPRGISNGLSDVFNDGADFGPDTPGTTTSGIQEALATGKPVFLLGGEYNVENDIVLNNNNTVLIGIGGSSKVTLNMNQHRITTTASTLENVYIEGLTLINGSIVLVPPAPPTSLPLPFSNLTLRDIHINNNIASATSMWWVSVINYWMNVAMEDFYIDDVGTPTAHSDAMGLGGNIRLVWRRGHLYAPTAGGAGINWQGGLLSTTVQYSYGSLLFPTATSNTTNTNYLFEDVDIVADILSLDLSIL